MYRRRRRHNLDSVTIGRYAGEESNTENTVSIGRKAGYSAQAQWAIAIGDRAGEETQALNAICIGVSAGQSSQSTFAIAVGDQAGRTTQGARAIAVGTNAGQSNQATLAIAVGTNAGQTAQGAGAIAIGETAGQTAQGANSIAIGNRAGTTGQVGSSIVISTSDSEITAAKKGLYIDPIRNFDDRDSTIDNGNILTHLHETKEVVTGLPKLPCYTSDLTTSEVGSMYFNTTIKRVKVYNGTTWVVQADEEDLRKLKAELMAAMAAAAAALAATASATSSGGGAYVSGSEGNVPTVGGGSSTQYYNADGTPAQAGYDFYWEPVPGTTAYNPVFYKDLTVVETVRTKTDGVTPLDRDDRPGAMTTIYNNGHRSIEPIPIEVWNPPAAAWNALPQDERRAVTNEYATANNIDVMISNPGGDGDSEAVNTFTGDAFRAFLESKL